MVELGRESFAWVPPAATGNVRSMPYIARDSSGPAVVLLALAAHTGGSTTERDGQHAEAGDARGGRGRLPHRVGSVRIPAATALKAMAAYKPRSSQP